MREKTADTGEVSICHLRRDGYLSDIDLCVTAARLPQILDIARKTKEVCMKYGVPVIINDRVDIALAVGADGVHLGQTDMPVPIARSLLPPGAVIGKTCNTPEHVRIAVEEGVQYVGLGPVWDTKTKNVTSPVTGPTGIGEMLQALDGTPVKAVAIGQYEAHRVTVFTAHWF